MCTEALLVTRRPLERDQLRQMVDKGIDRIHAIVMIPFDAVVNARGWEAMSVLVEDAIIDSSAMVLDLEYWPIGLQNEADKTSNVMVELKLQFAMIE